MGRPTANLPAPANQRGVTLLELLVAMLILAMVSVMLYSVLNVGIGFSRKGEARARQSGQQRAFLELLHRQVHGVRYDRKQKKVLLVGDNNQLTLVTTAPLLNRDLKTVLAVYLYDPEDDSLYYTEEKDFYNADYRDDYRAERREMRLLMREVGGLDWDYQAAEGRLVVTCGGQVQLMTVRSWLPEEG